MRVLTGSVTWQSCKGILFLKIIIVINTGVCPVLRNSFAPEAFHTLFKSLTLGSPTELWDGHSYLRTKFYLKDFQRRILFLNRIQTRHTFYSKTYFLGNFTFAEGLGATSAGSTLPPTLWVPPTSVENFRKLPVLSRHPLNNSRTHASLSLFCL